MGEIDKKVDNIDQAGVRVVSLAAELGSTDAFHISRSLVRRTPPVMRHRHEFFEVFWITTGYCTHFINAREEQITPGMLAFIRPDDTHAFQNFSIAPCRMINVAFSQATAGFLQDRYGDELGSRFFWSESENPSSYLLDQKSLDELDYLEKALDRGARTPARIEAFLLHVMTTLLSNETEVPGTAPTWLLNACEAMHDPASLREGVQFLVRNSGRSHEHVARSFRRHFGQTPSSWVNGMRMSLAARLLLSDDQPILEIALACGIEDLSHFYRLFRQTHGVSPRRYRRRQQVDLVDP